MWRAYVKEMSFVNSSPVTAYLREASNGDYRPKVT
jgi:hypothetical protein